MLQPTMSGLSHSSGYTLVPSLIHQLKDPQAPQTEIPGLSTSTSELALVPAPSLIV